MTQHKDISHARIEALDDANFVELSELVKRGAVMETFRDMRYKFPQQWEYELLMAKNRGDDEEHIKYLTLLLDCSRWNERCNDIAAMYKSLLRHRIKVAEAKPLP